MAHQRYKEKNQEDKEENLRNACRGYRNSREAKHCRQERHYEET
jgi:hypothetical protein